MIKFNEWLEKRNENFVRESIPADLSYYITNTINREMRRAGQMPPQEKHTPPGVSSDPELAKLYNPSLKQKLKSHFLGFAQKMAFNGSKVALMNYFGFDPENPLNQPGEMTKFMQDIRTMIDSR